MALARMFNGEKNEAIIDSTVRVRWKLLHPQQQVLTLTMMTEMFL